MITFRHQIHPVYMMLIWYCNYIVWIVIYSKWGWNIGKSLGVTFASDPISWFCEK